MSASPLVTSQAVAGLACVAQAWQAHEGELRGYLRRRLGDTDTADDVLQDVFVKAVRQGQGFCTLTNARAWLFQVARNALIDQGRTQHPTEPLAEDAPIAAPAVAELAPVDALADCVTRVIGKLAPEDTAILRACDLQGQTVRAYAQAQGLSLAAAKSRLLRARHRLRERLVTDCRVGFDEHGAVCCHFPRDAAD
ncbi:sigma-70 family RNA polymerase sigma factor [Denitromonas sp.]|uniref:sigma-70 family RNA polymerase sigma factor n=1 Tax=Denitromonas sp. TaxID=2734609 RepID=UPI002AFE2DD3|nr:sigma-70 family RNA polymerase sigma factor [Denitromonas sp.]